MSHETPQSLTFSPDLESVTGERRLNAIRRPKSYATGRETVQSLLETFAQKSNEQSVFEGHTSSVIAGSYTDRGGLRKYRLRDEHGTEEEFERPSPRRASDIQTVPRVEEYVDRRPCSERVADNSLSISDRLGALRSWIAREPSFASDFVVSQLTRDDQSPEWLRIVIYTAEDVRFPSPEARLEVAESLIKHALRLRGSLSAEDGPVVMSAIRRAGSICSDQHFEGFVDLLNGGMQIDTRLVTLQTLSRRFMTKPPNVSELCRQLAERASTLAQKHWDVDVFRAGEVSAIASEATLVAVQLDARDVERCAELAKATKRRYVVRKLVTKLKEIRENWLSNSALEAVSRIDAVLAKLS